MARSKRKKSKKRRLVNAHNQNKVRRRYDLTTRSVHSRKYLSRAYQRHIKQQEFDYSTPDRNINKQLSIPVASYSYTQYHRDGETRYKKQVCDARKTKREVLFATKKAGTGQSRKPKFTLKSKIKC